MKTSVTPEDLAKELNAKLERHSEIYMPFLTAREIFPTKGSMDAWAKENGFFLIHYSEEERITISKKPRIKANPRCKFCLGTGQSQGFYAGVIHICACVVEQIIIVTSKKDYSIKDRYSPGPPEFVEK